MQLVLKSSSFAIADITGLLLCCMFMCFCTLLVIVPHMDRVHADDRKCFRK